MNILIKNKQGAFMDNMDNFPFENQMMQEQMMQDRMMPNQMMPNQMMPNQSDSTTVGRVMSVDIPNRFFTVMTDPNPNSAIRFNLSDNANITDFFGRPINICCLSPGSRVRVRHANFMTRSIPPQTTAFSVRIIG